MNSETAASNPRRRPRSTNCQPYRVCRICQAVNWATTAAISSRLTQNLPNSPCSTRSAMARLLTRWRHGDAERMALVHLTQHQLGPQDVQALAQFGVEAEFPEVSRQ